MAVVTDLVPRLNEKDYAFPVSLLVEKNICQIPYITDYYRLRDRCCANRRQQAVHTKAILIAEYSSDDML